MTVKRDVDVLVVGGGLVGAAAACLLAKQGRQVLLVDRQVPPKWDGQQPRDLRVFAIAPGSANILASCDVWQAVSASRTCAYQAMEVTAVHGGLLRFQAHEHGLEQLGWIVENRLLQSQLWEQLNQSVEVLAPASIEKVSTDARGAELLLGDGSHIRARLLLAADGARSFVRQALNMEVVQRDYQQRALVAELDTETPNSNTAWQIFLKDGPLALLPLDDGRSSMVWSLPQITAEAALQWDSQKMGAELSLHSNGRFGHIKLASEVLSFPLHMLLAKQMRDQRVLLLGDAAHQVHPLAGQGVNLGLQDAAAIAQQLEGVNFQDNLALEHALNAFERWRVSESTVMTKGIDGIQRLFAGQPGIGGLGLSAVERLWPLKDRFMQHACGLHTAAPEICRQ